MLEILPSLKTSANAIQVVLPGEEAAQFAELEQLLVHDFEPVGVAEAAMVHDLAVLTWKKLRVDRVEHAVMMQTALQPLPEDTIAKLFGPGWLPQALLRVEPSRPVTQEEFDETTELLAQANALLAAAQSQPTARSVMRKWPMLYAALQDWADDYARDGNELIEGTLVHGLGLAAALHNIIDSKQIVLWLWEHRERLSRAVQQARDSRLLQYMKSADNVTQRAFDDLGRSFYRTLAELRRQQDWRIRRTAISIDDQGDAQNL